MPTVVKIASVELRLMLRDGANAFFGLIFPALLLAALTLLLPGFGDVVTDPEAPAELIGLRPVDIYLPVVLALSIATVALTILPVYLATYRERGVLRRLETTPAAAQDLLGAQLLVNLASLTVGAGLAVVVAMLFFNVDAPANAPGLLLAFLLATVATFAVGLLIAAVAPNGRVASGIAMIVYFPMLFFAGVWTPGPTMPDAIRAIADFTPLGAAAEAISDAWFGDWPTLLHAGVLVGWTLLAGAAASRLFRWQ